MNFNINVLQINPAEETKKIADFVTNQVYKVFRRRGVVVGLSGGIDSAVMTAIAVRSIGKENVVGLILPDKESNPVSRQYADAYAETLGIDCREIDITPTVESVGVYHWRDEYIKNLIPDYSSDCKYNISPSLFTII